MARNGDSRQLDLFLGNYEVKITSSYRIVIPPEFRAILGSSAILTKGFDNNILLIPEDKWKLLIEPLRKSPLFDDSSRNMARYLVANSYRITLDKQGRFVIPSSFRKNINSEKLVLAGMLDYIEIWPLDKWEKQQRLLENNVDKIAKNLNE